MKRILLVLAAMALAAAASAQTYKWVDKNGKVQYGDTPPGDASSVTRLKTPSGGAAPAPAAAPEGKKDATAAKDKALTPEQAFQKRQQDREKTEQTAEKERAKVEEKRANCETAQSNLRQLQSGQRMWTVNAAGERVFVDDDQRAREADRAQQAVSRWCS